MPELPEVETVRRGLEPALVGQKIMAVDIRRPDLRVPFPENLNNLLRGRTVMSLARRAKYLLAMLDGGDALVFHLGMSGQMTIVADVKSYSPKKHDHMILTLASGEGVVFNDARRFGMVLWLARGTLDSYPAFSAMGPEPLGNDFNGPVLRMRLSGKKIPIKIALLDQRVVAGVGNIYASEALHEAGISPDREAGSLTKGEGERLVAAIRNVLMRAIEAGGSSLKDFRKADGNPGYFQHSFSVYDREGQACTICVANGKKKSIIQKTMQGGRATYFCARCQK